MWHVLHLIARPIEVLLGVFCVLTAIVLYPDEEGKLQSRLEDFWVRVDDYKLAALSQHTVFMRQVASLESSVFDSIFGKELFTEKSLAISFSLSTMSEAILLLANPAVAFGPLHWGLEVLILVSILTAILNSRFPESHVLCIIILIPSGFLAGLCWTMASEISSGNNLGYLKVQDGFVLNAVLMFGGAAYDILFVITTRLLIRWAGQMDRTYKLVCVILLNLGLAIALLGPGILLAKRSFTAALKDIVLADVVAVSRSNLFDVVLALLFVALALMLLTHRAIWPLLTRTLFRMTDIGTKGRRAILTTIGLALLAAGVTGKVPELLQKLIEKLGG
jgi:hypothetical protein